MLASFWDILMWVGIAAGLMIVVAIGAVLLLGVSLFSGDADLSLIAQIAGLILTVLSLPFLIFIGLPVCCLWPVPKDQPDTGIRRKRIARLFTWWAFLFDAHNN